LIEKERRKKCQDIQVQRLVPCAGGVLSISTTTAGPLFAETAIFLEKFPAIARGLIPE